MNRKGEVEDSTQLEVQQKKKRSFLTSLLPELLLELELVYFVFRTPRCTTFQRAEKHMS